MDRGWGRVTRLKLKIEELCKSSLLNNDLRYEDLIGVIVPLSLRSRLEGRPRIAAILQK